MNKQDKNKADIESVCHSDEHNQNECCNPPPLVQRGPAGPRGVQGPQGIQGPPGKNGAVGAQGLPGKDGAQGIQGLPGKDGAQGIQGLPGKDGAQGIQGLPGKDGAQGIQGPPGEDGAQGIQGLPGKDGAQGIQGPPGTSCECICYDQMKYVISQLIEIYSEDNFTVNMEDGNTASGKPIGLSPSGIESLLSLDNGSNEEYANICKIASISITSATYASSIKYLPVPEEESECCTDECEAGIRKLLPVGTNTIIKSGGQSSGDKTVIASQFGIIVVVGPRDSSPEFISSCKIETIIIK